MFKLARAPEGIEFLRWNKRLPSASSQDPLGLNLRVSARLAGELLHCITSITPRARYYAFFAWAFQDYFNNEQGHRGDRGRIDGVLAREKAMVLGSVLHHEGRACEGGALGGSIEASKLARGSERRHYDIASWKHLDNSEGQFGAAYKASLVNLGLFDVGEIQLSEEVSETSNELDQAVQTFEVSRLSERGKRLARAFARSVRTTRFVREEWAVRRSVPGDVLKQFGSRAGLCEISLPGAADRDAIRDVLFSCDRDSRGSAHYRRRMSLLLMLDAIRKLQRTGLLFDAAAFSDLTYFGRVLPGGREGKSVRINIAAPLRDIAERWRVFHFHTHLTTALQSLLVAVVGVLRDHPGGIDREQIIEELQLSAVQARFKQLFGTALPRDFLKLTPCDMLKIAGIDTGQAARQGSRAWEVLDVSSPFGERRLSDLLAEGEAGNVAAIPLAAMLLYTVLLRYETIADTPYDAWHRRHVEDPFGDVSVPGVLNVLRAEWGKDWWRKTNRDVLNLVIRRFVLYQHQTMGYERGFGGGAPLFHIDGATVVGTSNDFEKPAGANARFSSALQILVDLGLVAKGEDHLLHLTAQGDSWLGDLLEQEAGQ